MNEWKVEQLLRESREAEGRARDLEQRARRARREAVHARMEAWKLTVEARDESDPNLRHLVESRTAWL